MEGNLAFNLLILLERRLDNIVFRMNFAPTRRAARQLVSHGHVLVNGKRVDIPSAWVSVNDVISISEKCKNIPLVNQLNENDTPEFVDVDVYEKKGILLRYPLRKEISPDINEVYVAEWYKRLV